MEDVVKTIIIGGGPSGITSGIYLLRAGITPLLLEKMVPGGQPLNTQRIENYPGFPDPLTGRELMERFLTQAKNYGLEIKEFQEVLKVEKRDKLFSVETRDKTYWTHAIIVACGTVPARLNIPGEDRFIGRGVSFCATCDGFFFRDMEIAVIGGGDSALEEALFLASIAKKVYVVHRRQTFRAQKILVERAQANPKIEFFLGKKPIEVRGDESIRSLVLEDTSSGKLIDLPVEGIFVYIGSRPETSFLGDLVERDESGFILTSEDLSTKTEGLFAAGDCRKKILRQITTAVGDGALAAYGVERYLKERNLV